MKHYNKLGKVAFVLLIIGGLNWGLMGLFQMDIVQIIFGSLTTIITIVYVLIGLSALYLLINEGKN
jgi:uncharacterized protein